MKVILLDNIRGIGRVGDCKEVNDGYARNFLLPRKLAKPASAHAQEEAAALKVRLSKTATMADAEALALAARMRDAVVVIRGKASEKGRLFAGIEAQHIAAVLSKEVGAHILGKSILLPEHIKQTGDHAVAVRLGLHTVPIVVRVEAEA